MATWCTRLGKCLAKRCFRSHVVKVLLLDQVSALIEGEESSPMMFSLEKLSAEHLGHVRTERFVVQSTDSSVAGLLNKVSVVTDSFIVLVIAMRYLITQDLGVDAQRSLIVPASKRCPLIPEEEASTEAWLIRSAKAIDASIVRSVST